VVNPVRRRGAARRRRGNLHGPEWGEVVAAGALAVLLAMSLLAMEIVVRRTGDEAITRGASSSTSKRARIAAGP
jgi:hypothetical protein